ncbi:MAG: FxsA family protein [Bdellovibrionales bacterium]
MPFLVIFVVIPIIELMIFASVSEHIGLLTALLFALLTAVIGGNLVRLQGLQTLFELRKAVEAGRMPMSEIFDGFCLIAAGALLITPGFLTDTIGFALLVPAVRRFLRHVIKTHSSWAVETTVRQERPFDQSYRPRDPDVIEGEYERVEPDKDA